MFKGNILATASASSGKSKKDPDDYFAYLIDAQTGKLLLKKQVYQGTSDNYEDMETLFADDGSWARLLVRQTAASRKGRFMKVDETTETKQFTVINIRENLNPVVTQYNIGDGVYRGFLSNSADSFFALMFERGKAFKALKFNDGKPEAASAITKEMDLPEKLYSPTFTTKCTSSAKDHNVVYLAADYKGSGDYKLSICKFNFGNNSSKVVSEIITRDHIRDIKKNIDEAYKKVGDLSLSGYLFDFEVSHIADYDGTITVSFGNHSYWDSYVTQGSTIINGYDEDLNQKFQQVFVSHTLYGPTSDVANAYFYAGDNKLCVIANTGNMKFSTLYGQLDLNTGKWLSFKKLDKKKIDGSDFVTANNLWYKDNFALIYVPFKHSLGSNIDLSLQLNSY